jgi:hypothetical protein
MTDGPRRTFRRPCRDETGFAQSVPTGLAPVATIRRPCRGGVE